MDASVSNTSMIYRQPDPHSMTIFQNDIEDTLKGANRMALKELGDDYKVYEIKPRSRFCGGFFCNTKFKFSYWSGLSRRSNDKAALVILAVGAIVVGVGFLGKNLGKLVDTRNEINGNHQLECDYKKALKTDHPHTKSIKNVVKNYNELLRKRYQNKAINTALAAGAVAGGILLLVGTLASLTATSVVGGALILAAASGAIFKYFYKPKNNRAVNLASNINAEWEKLQINQQNRRDLYPSSNSANEHNGNAPIALSPKDKAALEKLGFTNITQLS